MLFVYSSSTPSMPLSIFSSFHTFLLSLYCFKNFLVCYTAMFPYACMDLLSICICPVLYPSLYFSSVASVHLHQNISTVLRVLYLSPCFSIFYVFFSLSFHICILVSNLLCHLFDVFNRMSITDDLCIGTHSSF